MLIKKAGEIPSSEITSQSVYLNRRKFLAGAAVAGVAAFAGLPDLTSPKIVAEAVNKFDGIRESSFSTNEIINEYKDVTTYDYYELPTDKHGPAAVLAKPRRRQNSCRVMPTISTAASAPI